MVARPLRFALIAALTATALPAMAQLASGSPGYQFLEAVRGDKGSEVTAILSKPGTRIINTQDPTTGEGALHIVVKRGDAVYVRYFLAQPGIDPNLKDNRGNTPLLLAVRGGHTDLIEILLGAKANANIANSDGDIPLILAVMRRDTDMVRILIDGGADPDKTDRAGLSARDVAISNATRDRAMADLFAAIPKKARRAVSGPTL
ncbi:MAG: ankyrin repeat domain-containing protein [Pseudomonadota bacterium]